MPKINYQQFKEEVINTGKSFWHISELKKIYRGNNASLKVLFSAWVKKKMIYHLGRGYYTFSLAKVDYLSLANIFEPQSYVSFEYALFYHNLIDQVPSTVTLVTKKRSKKIKMSNWVFEYTHLKQELFFGYNLKDKIYVATPEKALADLVYLIARGKRLTELDTLEKNKINQQELVKIFKKYPRYAEDKARELKII